jgi:hypothetical protein
MEKIIGFFTDKGNVSVKVRNALKVQALKQVQENLAINFPNVVLGKDNAFYIEIGQDKDVQIYARLELTISIKDPND